MPYVRKLPSGKWNAVVRGADGKRHTHTAILKREAVAWGLEQEALARRGVVRDPRLGRTTLGEWAQRWWAARSVARTTMAKDESLWRCHIAPYWRTWQMQAITRVEVQTWIKHMTQARVGAPTISSAYRLFAAMVKDATLETPPIIDATPCHDIDLPAAPRRPARVFTSDQLARLLAELPGQWRVYWELDSYTGLRAGELAAIHEDQVDWGTPLRIVVHRVLTRYGLREWPKTQESNRVVPVPERLRADLWALAADRPQGAPLFTLENGKWPRDDKLRARVWYPALLRAGACPQHRARVSTTERAGHVQLNSEMAGCAACDPLPFYPPKVLRHTAASLLLRAGVPKAEVKELLGHTDERTTSIYAQFEAGQLPAVEAAWRARDPQMTHGGQRHDEEAPSLEGERASDSPTT